MGMPLKCMLLLQRLLHMLPNLLHMLPNLLPMLKFLFIMLLNLRLMPKLPLNMPKNLCLPMSTSPVAMQAFHLDVPFPVTCQTADQLLHMVGTMSTLDMDISLCILPQLPRPTSLISPTSDFLREPLF